MSRPGLRKNRGPEGRVANDELDMGFVSVAACGVTGSLVRLCGGKALGSYRLAVVFWIFLVVFVG